MDKRIAVMAVLAVLGMSWAVALAEDAPVAESTRPEAKEQADAPLSGMAAIAVVGASLGAGLCAIGGGYAIARIGSKCIEAIARQPEAAEAMFAPMIVSAAMVEGGMLFAIVVCLLGVMAAS